MRRTSAFSLIGVVVLLAGVLLSVCGGGKPAPPAPSPPVVEEDEPPSDWLPGKLSDLRAFSDPAKLLPGEGFERYGIKYQYWCDGATGDRSFRLPPGSRIDVDDEGGFRFPEGSVFTQTLSLPGPGSDEAARIETRVMSKKEGRWAYATYLWDEERTEAIRTNGLDVSTRHVLKDGSSTWTLPGRITCIQCHNHQCDKVIGFAGWQLSGELLGRLEKQGTLAKPLAAVSNREIRGRDEAERDAIAYIGANCAHCHSSSNPTIPAGLDLRPFRLPGTIVNVRAQRLVRGDATLYVAPGEPDQSVLFRLFDRTFDMTGHDRNRFMPPIGNQLRDPDGRRILETWIKGLK